MRVVEHHHREWVLMDATERRVASAFIPRYEDMAQTVNLSDGPIATVKSLSHYGGSFEAHSIDGTPTGAVAAGTVAGILSTYVRPRPSRVTGDVRLDENALSVTSTVFLIWLGVLSNAAADRDAASPAETLLSA